MESAKPVNVQRLLKANPLSSEHREYLRARAVADTIAKQRGYRTIRLEEKLEEYGFSKSQLIAPTLLIPIHGVDGKIRFYQHRPDEPRTVYKRIGKFESAKGSRNALDIHPTMLKYIGDPKIPKVITEGAPKVDACLSIGLPAIGLMGVFGFRGTNEDGGLTALADWESIAMNGGTFYAAFDSDAMLKKSVYVALDRVKRFLESRGAIFKIIYLPQPAVDSTASKTGIDDYIAQQLKTGQTPGQVRDTLLATAVDELRPPPIQGVDPKDDRPAIEICQGYYPEIVDNVTVTLAAKAERLRLFQRGGGAEIQQVIVLSEKDAEEAEKKDHIYRPPGSVLLRRPSTTQMRDILDREIMWYVKSGKDLVITNCPVDIAQRYLERIGQWKLPHLLGVIEAPLVLPDGTVLRAPGYNAATGLYLFSEIDWPDIKKHPTKKDALAALEVLRQPFSEFPFEGKDWNRPQRVCADESVVLSMVLTAIQRRLIDHAPLYGLDAPLQGTGKSLAVKVTGLIATGRPPTSSAVAKSEDERRKAIFSLLREGHLIINLDNITEVFISAVVAQVITEDVYGDRILGESETESHDTRVLITATGNNLRFGGDLTGRALVSRMDAKMERPDQREFKKKDLPGWILEHRIELVTAVLTILSAWFVARRSMQKGQRIKPWGRVMQWSHDIREALIWLGCADPCDKRDETFGDDPDVVAGGDILRLWHKALGENDLKWVTVAEVVSAAYKNTGLRDLILPIAPSKSDSSTIDPARFGNWCAENRDRVINGFHLVRKEQSNNSKGARQWRVYKPVVENPTYKGRKNRIWGD